jgi:hypothetical protein
VLKNGDTILQHPQNEADSGREVLQIFVDCKICGGKVMKIRYWDV